MKSYLLITGATGGLGSAFVLEACKKGYDLVISDLPADGERFANLLAEKFKVEVLYRPCDLSREEDRTRFLTGLKQEGFRFWGLVNVAGLDHEGAFLEKTRSQILRILQINVLATLDITHGILSLRDPEARFRLVNVCSMAGFYPMPFKATYAASKRFLLDMSTALREEIRSFGTVTALCPAGMPTTVECMRSMFAQGFWGLATGMDPAVVARKTLRAAVIGRSLVIPGWLNNFIHLLGSLVPPSLSARYVARRWGKARAKLEEQNLLREATLQSSHP